MPLPQTTDAPCLHDLLSEQARAHPRARAALETGGAALTWGALARKVRDLAHRLRALGIQDEAPVGVCMDRSLDLVVAMLAVLEAGGLFVPLDPSLPDRRLAWILEDAGIDLVLEHEATRGRATATTALRVDRLPAPTTTAEPLPGPTERSAAYMIYTSGSTGQPKGVVVEHRSIVALARALPGRFAATRKSRLLQYSSIAFDVSFFDVALWLGSGAPLVLAPAARIVPGPELHQVLADERITHLTCTPTVLSALSHEGLPRLRQLMIGGEPLPPDLVARFGPGRSLWNVYGPTEATVAATAFLTDGADDWAPIGTPIGPARVRVVDDHGRPVPDGESGEILLGGPGVARGYHRRPALTAARFVDRPDGRWYRTGDRGHLRPDGNLVFDGRVDGQVKVRGVRIELSEIEVVLRAHPGVREAVVDARADGGPTRLVAYVVPSDTPSGSGDWRRFLAERLPAAYVPSAFVALDALPLLPSSKVDRSALPPPSGERPELDEPFVAPAGPAEQRVARLFAELLAVAPIGARDDFFALGGDSLVAVRLLAALDARFGQRVDPEDFYTRPTVRAVAEALDGAAPDALPALDTPAGPVLSLSQTRLWFGHRLAPEATNDQLPAVLHVRGPLDGARLRAAFAAIVERHAVLRTVIPTRGGEPAPELLPADDPRLALPEVEPVAPDGLDALVQQEHRRPFDLASAPPWRVRIGQAAPEHHLLVLTFHHVLVDAASLGVLVRDLAALLDGDPLPPPPSPFALAARERSALASGALDRSLSWWRDQLADAPAWSGLPTDRPPTDGPRVGAGRHFHLPATAVGAARALGQQHGATPFQTLLVALADALRAQGAGDDLVIGTPVATDDPTAQASFGFFANTVPLRLRGGGSRTHRVKRARQVALGAFAHADAPFDQVVARLAPDRSPGRTPLIQVVLAVQQPAPRDRTRAGLELALTHLVADVAPFELTVELWPTDDGGYDGAALYDARLYEPATIDGLVDAFLQALDDLGQPHPDRPLAEVHGAALPAPDPVPGLAHALLRTAERHGTHRLRCVEADGTEQAWTYAQLAKQAAAFAHGLRDLGLEPGQRVVLQHGALHEQLRAFWGCLFAGLVPMILPLPQAFDPSEARVDKLRGVTGRLGAVVLASAGLHDPLERVLPGVAVHVVEPGVGPFAPASAAPTEVAFVQASSGSTGSVKLIPETHGAVLRHVQSASAHTGYTAADQTLSWLPLDHVASLLMCHVKDVVLGASQTHLRTERVLADPLVLFDTVDAEATTHLLAPNFAYALLLDALDGAPDRRWDLSSLRRIANGAEAVSPRVTGLFLDRAARFGLDPAAMQPGFGMAETASVVTFDNRFRLASGLRHVRRQTLEVDLVFEAEAGPHTASFVSLGGPLPGVGLRIVDDGGAVQPEGVVGRLLVRGPTVFPGYLDTPGGPGADGWFDTGDLGFLLDGKLSLVGRAKHTLVVAGAKVQAEEVEELVAAVPGVAARGVAACAVPAGESESLAVFVVPDGSVGPGALVSRVRERITARLGVAPDHVVPVPAEALPRTTAGKLQRKALARQFAQGRVRALAMDGPLPGAFVRTWRTDPTPAGRPADSPAPRVFKAPDSVEAALLALARVAAEPGAGPLIVASRQPLVDAALAGAVACLAWEQPELEPRLVRLPASAELAAACLDRECALAPGPREVCWRDGVRKLPHLEPTALSAGEHPFRPGSCWLITGGTGGIGTLLATHLRSVHGVRVRALGRQHADVADLDALRAAVADAERTWARPLDGVLHLAAVLEEGPLAGATAPAIDRALRPKLAGTRALTALLADRPHTWLVAFGSVAGHSGAPRAGLYAAADRVQQALVDQLHRSGHTRARMLCWPGWVGVGLARDRAIGIGLDPQVALRAVAPALAAGTHLVLAPAPVPAEPTAVPAGPREAGLRARIAAIWREALNLDAVDPDASFFALGGHSILLVQVCARLESELGRPVPVAELFRRPTVAALAHWLAGDSPEPEAPTRPAVQTGEAIAVVGLAGRFPGGRDVEGLWQALLAGDSLARTFGPEELAATGVPEAERTHPDYVPVRAVLDDVAGFDAGLFGMTPAEAAHTDPQHRLFLECAWEALEAAGIDPARWTGEIGVFAAAGLEGYLLHHLAARPRGDALSRLGSIVGNDKDHIAPRVAFKLDLRGPAVTVQTACSSSLVAVHQGCRELLAGTCDAVLAGGSNVGFPLNEGHLFQEGHIVSPDGECRAFDARAAGTFGGDGAGAVVLMRLSDALAGGHPVRAVIRGSAVNNDGGRKAGYTAPSTDGQARVIRAALASSDLDPQTIGYIEAHGTGTALGDPVEVAALAEALGPRPDGEPRYLGALKANLGHTNAAAGVAALIKAVLVVERGQVPPLRHFTEPNPRLDLSAASLVPPTEPTDWRPTGPRRAGVSAFGFGGTNAHVVLEQAPVPVPPDRAPTDRPVLLPLSARTPTALKQAAERLADHLETHPELDLGDVACTLQLGRRALAHRAAYRARDRAEALAGLRAEPFASGSPPSRRPVVFLFPGQGAQHPGMLRGLVDTEPVVRDTVDAGAALLVPLLGLDLRPLLTASPDDADARAALAPTAITQPALVLAEVALARLWQSRGVHPTAVLGHSVGEWAAAIVAGVLPFEAGLELVAQRGLACGRTEAGAMLTVALPPEIVEARLPDGVHVAVENASDATVVAGPPDAVEGFAAALERDRIPCQRLGAAHAFHSPSMAPAEQALAALLASAPLSAPSLPLISGTTGTWMTPEEATDPARWAAQATLPVRFAAALHCALADPDGLMIEVGPRRTLTAFAARSGGTDRALATLRSSASEPTVAFVEALGRAWVRGVPLQPDRGDRRRVVLPPYPFERQRHWIDAPTRTQPRPTALTRPARVPVDSAVHPPPTTLAVIGVSEGLTVTLANRGATLQTAPALDAEALAAWLEGLRAQDASPTELLLLEPSPTTVASLLQALTRRLFRLRLNLVAVLGPETPEREATDGMLAAADGTVPGLTVRRVHHDGAAAESLADALAGPTGRVWLTAEGRFTEGEAPTAAGPLLDGPRLVFEGPRGDGLTVAESLADAGVPVALVPWTAPAPALDPIQAALGDALDLKTLDDHPGLRAALDSWCTARVLGFLESVGLDLSPGARFTRAGLVERLSLRPAFERLLDALLQMPVEDGFLAADAGGFTATDRPRTPASALEARLRADHPRFVGILDWVDHCVSHYADALSGRIDAIGVIYPAGGGNLVDACDRRTAEHRHDRRQILLLAHVLRRLVSERGPSDRPFRILELGGGQGLLTWPLLQALVDLPVELHFTDLGALFVEDARREARSRGVEDRMRFDKLDISQPADPRRFPPGSYDAVVAYNVIHAAPDVPEVLRHLRPLLAPGGQLAVVEVTRTERWDAMSWGLAEGWWYFEDDVRTDGPLLPLGTWEQLLDREGYVDAAAWPRPGDERDVADHGLLLARAPGASRAPSRAARRQALSRMGHVHLVDAPSPAEALTAATEALGAVTAVVVEPDVGPPGPLLATPPEAWPHRLQAAREALAAQLDALGPVPLTLLGRDHDAEQAPVDTALAELAESRGLTVLTVDRRTPAELGSLLQRELPAGVLRPVVRAPEAPPAATPEPPAPAAAPEPRGRPPRTPLEATVAAVAAEILGLPTLGLDDDFVELGADSLIMLRMTDRLAKELGRPVPSEATFRGTSVARLAAALDETAPAPPEGSPLIPIQPKGSKPPFFMVHPATGMVFLYYGLAREMGTDRPFYGIQARGLDGLAPHDTRIEDMARHYVAALRAFQPHGPYHIGGFSFGCYVAYEMAVQLEEAGEPPGSVVLIDEPAPIDGYRPSPWIMADLIRQGATESLRSFLPEYLSLVRDAPPAARPTYTRRRDRLFAPLERFLARSTLHAFIPPEQRPVAMRQPALLRMFELFVLHSQLTLSYQPRAYPHGLNLLKATDLRGKAARDITQGWRILAAGGVEVHRMPGEHLTMLRDPHVKVVAETVNRCLDAHERRHS